MTEGKWKLEWCRVKKNIRFLNLFIPRSSDCKNNFSRILGNFIRRHVVWIYIIFHILTQPKIRENKYSKFQRHSLLTALHKKNLRMRTTYFLVLVFGHRWSVGLMKSKIVKVKSFYNNLIHHLLAITEFLIFLGPPNVQCTLSEGWVFIVDYIQVLYHKLTFCAFVKLLKDPFNCTQLYKIFLNTWTRIIRIDRYSIYLFYHWSSHLIQIKYNVLNINLFL